MQLLFESSTEHEGAAGLGILPGDGDAPGVAAAAAHRLEPRHLRAGVAADRGPRRRRGLLPRALVRLPPADASDVVGTSEYGERFVSVVERDNVMAAQFHPEKSSSDGLRMLRNFAAAGGGRGRMILYPAIDIMDGQAVRLVEGRFEDATTYHDDPLEAARSWVEAGARFLHVVDLDGARSGEPNSLEHLRAIVGHRHPDPVRRRPAHGRRRPRRAARRRRARDRRHRRVPRHRLPRRHRRRVRPADRRRRRRQGRHDRHRGLDADDVSCPPSRRSSA